MAFAWDTMTKGECNKAECDKPARSKNAFYCVEHQPIKSPRRAKKTSKAFQPEAPAREVIVEAVSSAASSTPSKSEKPPSASEWTNLIAPILALITSTVAYGALKHRQSPDLSPEERKALDDEYDRICLSDEEVNIITKPMSRLIAKSVINEKYGRVIVENADILMATWTLWEWGNRVRPYMREAKMVRKANRRAEQVYYDSMAVSNIHERNSNAPSQPQNGPTGSAGPDLPDGPRPSWYS